MSRGNEVGEDPCRAEGGCPMMAECRVACLDCLSFRMFVSGRPRIGIDLEACKREKGYKFKKRFYRFSVTTNEGTRLMYAFPRLPWSKTVIGFSDVESKAFFLKTQISWLSPSSLESVESVQT